MNDNFENNNQQTPVEPANTDWVTAPTPEQPVQPEQQTWNRYAQPTQSNAAEEVPYARPVQPQAQQPYVAYNPTAQTAQQPAQPYVAFDPNGQPSLNKKSNGLGIASLVLGICSAVFCCCGLGTITALVGLILGIISVAKQPKGNGIGIAGIVLCAAFLVLSAVTLIGAIATGDYADLFRNLDFEEFDDDTLLGARAIINKF